MTSSQLTLVQFKFSRCPPHPPSSGVLAACRLMLLMIAEDGAQQGQEGPGGDRRPWEVHAAVLRSPRLLDSIPTQEEEGSSRGLSLRPSLPVLAYPSFLSGGTSW